MLCLPRRTPRLGRHTRFRPLRREGPRKRILMRLRDNPFSHGIHPYVPRNRFRVVVTAKNVIVETPLPKSFKKIVAKQVAGLLLPLRDESYEIRPGAGPLQQEVDVIRHQTIRVDAKLRLLRGSFQGFDCNRAAAGVLKNNSPVLATNRDEGKRET